MRIDSNCSGIGDLSSLLDSMSLGVANYDVGTNNSISSGSCSTQCSWNSEAKISNFVWSANDVAVVRPEEEKEQDNGGNGGDGGDNETDGGDTTPDPAPVPDPDVNPGDFVSTGMATTNQMCTDIGSD